MKGKKFGVDDEIHILAVFYRDAWNVSTSLLTSSITFSQTDQTDTTYL